MRAVVSWGTWLTITVLFIFMTVGLFFPEQAEPEPEPVVVEEPVIALPEEFIMQTPIEPEVPFYSERDLECLALNAYFESRNQSVAGQIAVSQVVMNRVESPRFPNTICEVINQGPTYVNWKGNEMPKRNQCHFSWW